MRQIIRTVEQYKPMTDRIETAILIKLENKKEVFAVFEHKENSNYISNEELISKLRQLADHIENNHAQS